MVTFGSVLRPLDGLSVAARATVEALADLGVDTEVISQDTHEPGSLPSTVTALHRLKTPLHLGWSRELSNRVRSRSRAVDVVIAMSALLLPAIRVGSPRLPLIWDTLECETLHYSRLPKTPENVLRLVVWRAIERWASARCAVAVAVSDADADWWKRLFPEIAPKLCVIPHRPLYSPRAHRVARARVEELHGLRLGPAVLTFVGNLRVKQNVAAADWLVRVLAPRLPGSTTLLLAGTGTDQIISDSQSDCQLVGLGAVEDVDSVVAAADVCLAPLAAGAGVKTKVLLYLAHGRRVVGTPVAFEGIEDAPGVVSSSLDGLADVVLAHVEPSESDSERAQREEAQRAWLEERHGRAIVAERWSTALSRVGER